MEIQTGAELSRDFIYSLDADDLIDVVPLLFDLEPILRAPMLAYVRRHAMRVGVADIVTDLIKQLEEVEQKRSQQLSRAISRGAAPVDIDRNRNGQPIISIPNFVKVMRGDAYFNEIRYNLLRNAPETVEDGKLRVWSDADDSAAREYIEKVYKIYHVSKYRDAMAVLCNGRAYNPAKELIEAVEWDGVGRIEGLLAKWLKCEDTPYTREVSRLIFAGGIHRLYDPGCKFDDMPVLVGTRQGEGKTTFVNWLALEDRFYREVTAFDGQASMDILDGAWICEVGELLALTKTKEKEAVKSYLTRKVDTYRRSYGYRVMDYPRQCVFIGTTNKREFLTDMTGNRRFYPVVVNSSGYDLFDHKTEVQADILQCWAEAKVRMEAGTLPAVANRELLGDIKAMQETAREDDYRIGMIEDYIRDREQVCNIELWQEALNHPYDTPAKKDINEIGEIMGRMPAWERSSDRPHLPKYGRQRLWKRREVKIEGVEQGTFTDFTGTTDDIFDK